MCNTRRSHNPGNINLQTIGADVFDDCLNLSYVFLPDTLTEIAGSRADIPGVTTAALGDTDLIHGVHYDSFAAHWARSLGVKLTYEPHEFTLRANPPDLMYKYIPYEFTAKTKIPDNAGLRFFVSPVLPAGLKLADGVTTDPDFLNVIPGTIYGLPTDYSDFANGVNFTMTAWNKDHGSDPQNAPFGLLCQGLFSRRGNKQRQDENASCLLASEMSAT